jgi:uncharacterized Zn ribbon protein
LAIGQVDRCDLPAGKEDTVVAVAIERPDGKALADEGDTVTLIKDLKDSSTVLKRGTP